MTDSISLTRANLEALDLSYPDDLVSAELHLGANPACSRHLDGRGLACVLYLRTPTGIRGSNAHPGYVIELTEAQLLELGATEDDIFLAADARLADCLLEGDDEPCCAECASAVGGDVAEAPKPYGICQSCVTMIRESWDRVQFDPLEVVS